MLLQLIIHKSKFKNLSGKICWPRWVRNRCFNASLRDLTRPQPRPRPPLLPPEQLIRLAQLFFAGAFCGFAGNGDKSCGRVTGITPYRLQMIFTEEFFGVYTSVNWYLAHQPKQTLVHAHVCVWLCFGFSWTWGNHKSSQHQPPPLSLLFPFTFPFPRAHIIPLIWGT